MGATPRRARPTRSTVARPPRQTQLTSRGRRGGGGVELRLEDGRASPPIVHGRGLGRFRFRFESGNWRVQDGPKATATFVYVPGNCRPQLTVSDDRGAWGRALRGYSEK